MVIIIKNYKLGQKIIDYCFEIRRSTYGVTYFLTIFLLTEVVSESKKKLKPISVKQFK